MTQYKDSNKGFFEILIDPFKTELTLMEMLARITQLKASPRYQDCEIYLDGSINKIVAREVMA